jgi:lipopolysaccharide export system protein LptA
MNTGRKFRIDFLYIVIFYFLSITYVYSQTEQKKITIRAEWNYHDDVLFPGIEKMIGNVVFQQGEITGYCDSAYSYPQTNNVEAFSHVVIHLNDSVTLYGEYVFYRGNERIVSISKKVKLQDRTSQLLTDSLIYDLNQDVGYYVTGGRMLKGDNTLTSVKGSFYTKKDKIYLKEKVVIVNPEYIIHCDSILFDTQNEIVYFISRTQMQSEDNTIYTSGGWYNTKNDISELIGNVEIYNDAQKVFGDTVFYDKHQHYAVGRSNVVITDTVKNFVASGNYIEYHEDGGITLITDSAMLILIQNKDSLFVHADTFHIHIDSLQEPQLLVGFYHTKFFRTDMQGFCDSLSYVMKDSILTMFDEPVVWSQEYQLTADTIRFYIKDSSNMEIYLRESAFIVASIYEDSAFNQVKGTEIKGFIQNKILTHVNVMGNVECIYYLQEEDSSLIAINTSLTSEMKIHFADGKVSKILMYNAPDGKLLPDASFSTEERKLKKFRWLKLLRPKTMKDIFRTLSD